LKVLFVGEGNHDIGAVGERWGQPRPATGVVPALARRVCPVIDDESIALAWRDIPRFSRRPGKGFEAKVAAAILLTRRFGCDGAVCVSDRDSDGSRLPAMHRGKQAGLKALGPAGRAAVGVAVESIEAWTLGAIRALAEELELPLERIRSEMPKKHVEGLRESSGNEELRPKPLMQRLAEIAHRADGVALRIAVAERTDPGELAAACPEGFAPFAEDLRATF
jgi:hypothetical protein